jgi:imidazolonepropionase-like amidohydrolase
MELHEPAHPFRSCLRLLFSRAFLAIAAVALFSRVATAGDIALVGARLYPDPQSQAIEDAVVLIHDGKIAQIGKRGKINVPKSAQVIDCSGKVLTAGFWNSHVHFTNGWDSAASTPARELEQHMHDMLTRWGFTTVWDLGSDPRNTLLIRQKIKAGEIAGPQILMAGDIFPKNGHPVYLPKEMQLPEAGSPEEAGQMAKAYLQMDLDGIKLFTGSFMGDKPVVNMDAAIVKSAVAVAHAAGKPVFAHPQNRAGVDNALAGGVDVLAHTIPTEGSFTTDELSRMKRQHAALIPTLALWRIVAKDSPPPVGQRFLQAGVEELKAYSSVGGTILFGTDVGFTDEYDTTHEMEYMGRAMSWRDILASLTSNPSDFFKAPSKGRVAAGKDADLVVLDADPALDVRNLARVAWTIRDGRIIYSQ